MLIALISLVGTVVPQNRRESYYVNNYPAFVTPLILLTGMDHAAGSYITLVSLSFFFINLLTCSAARLRREFRTGTRRFGPDIIHLSLLLLIIGAYISIAGRSEKLLYLEKGDGAYISEEYSVRLKDFDYSVYDDGRTREWSSVVEILKNDLSIGEYPIEINKPVRISKGRLYQFDYRESQSVVLVAGDGREIRLEEGSLIDLDDGVFRYIGNDVTADTVSARFERYSGARVAYSVGRGGSMGRYRVEDPATRRLTVFKYAIDPGANIVFAALFMMSAGLAETIRRKLTDGRI